jgi:A nuclease of the HNH/ENDO VII superfamily with conserved WHH
MKEARKDGQEAADDARANAVALQAALGRVPPAVFGALGAPAQAAIGAALPVRPQQPRDVPISEREPPEHWPGWMKAWFKVGRGGATAIDGAAGLAEKAYENPEKIPGGLARLGESAWNDPIGFGKALIGYDELANGRIEDWLGQMGVGALGGAIGTVPARGARLNRVVGEPNPIPLGRRPAPINAKFAGARFDFRKEDFGMPEGRGKLPKISEEKRLDFAERYPNGVRFTRSGYPVLTPYEIDRVAIDNLTGDRKVDAKLANLAAGRSETPEDYTWHHVEDGRTMELVPEDLHDLVKHTGGAADIPQAKDLDIAPGGVFTPFEQNLNDFGAAAGGATAVAGAQEGRP